MEIVELKKIYQGKKVFVTGVTGFKGVWLLKFLEILGAKVVGYALKPEQEIDHFNHISKSSKVYFENICDASTLEKTLTEFKPDIIFHLAAQSLVGRSYDDPAGTYQTNVLGTLNLLNASRKIENLKAFVNITTDKVYENKEWHWAYRENDTLGGYDPYSSSKACVEIMTNSMVNSFFNKGTYKKEHQLLLANVRAGNVIGGGDWSVNRLIPDIIRAIENSTELKIRSPQSIRPWQHVLEPLLGYLKVGSKLLNEEIEFSGPWNFGPNANDMHTTVQNIIESASTYWPKLKYTLYDNPFHETSILKLDSSKANINLNWNAKWNTEMALNKTFEWYQDFLNNENLITENQILDYLNEDL